eukprot:933023-Karenia_brevis.AAC.1
MVSRDRSEGERTQSESSSTTEIPEENVRKESWNQKRDRLGVEGVNFQSAEEEDEEMSSES